MNQMIKRIAVGTLAALATHAFAGRSAPTIEVALPLAPAIPKTVAYIVKVEREGQVRELRLSGHVGAPLSTSVGSGEGDSNCTLVGGHGQRYELHASGGSKLDLTVLPVKDEDGVITTALQVSNYRAALGASKIDLECVVPVGHVETSSAFDVAAMRKDQSRTLRLSDGASVVVTLARVDD